MFTRDSTELADPEVVPSLADRWSHHTGGTHFKVVPCNWRATGHSGLHGMTFAGADPQTDTIFAVHLNGVTRHDEPASGDPDNSPLARRRLICRLIADATKPDAQRT